jgi:hypothetical protein
MDSIPPVEMTEKNVLYYTFFCPLIENASEAEEKAKNCATAEMVFTPKTGKALLILLYLMLATKADEGPLTVLNKKRTEFKFELHKWIDFLIRHPTFTSPFISLLTIGFRNEPAYLRLAIDAVKKDSKDEDKETIVNTLEFFEKNLPERMGRCFAIQLVLNSDKMIPKITLMMDDPTPSNTVSHSSEETPLVSPPVSPASEASSQEEVIRHG